MACENMEEVRSESRPSAILAQITSVLTTKTKTGVQHVKNRAQGSKLFLHEIIFITDGRSSDNRRISIDLVRVYFSLASVSSGGLQSMLTGEQHEQERTSEVGGTNVC